MLTLSNIKEKAVAGMVYVDTPLFSKKGDFRMLMSDLEFTLSNGKILSIKKGMYWDENSIPYLLQWAFPKSGMYAVPALIHDALYFDSTTTQHFADIEFLIWMETLGISRFQQCFRFNAVRLFGWIYWRKNKNNPSERCLRNRKLIKIM